MIKFLEVGDSAAGLKIKTNSINDVIIRILFYSIFAVDNDIVSTNFREEIFPFLQRIQF